MRLACELAATMVAGIGGHWLRRRDGRPYTSDGFRRLWHKAMRKVLAAYSDLARFTFHDLRAKAATDGEDWQLLGQLDQKTHSRIYDRKAKTVRPAR